MSIKRSLLLILMFSILLSTAVFVSAEDYSEDWNSVDCETYDWSKMDDSTWRTALVMWLKKDATLHDFFLIANYCNHDAVLQSVGQLLFESFQENHVQFIAELVHEDASMHQKSVECLVHSMTEHFAGNVLPLKMLDKDATDAEIALLDSIIVYTETYWGITIRQEPINIDWSNVNWEEVDFNEDTGAKLNSLLKWLREEATLEQHFAAVKYFDGAIAEGSDTILADRFVADPVGFIKTLAAADEVARSHVPVGVAGFWRDRDAFETVLSTVTLPDDATDVEKDLLLQIISKYEEVSGKEIENPKTGDPVFATAAVMILSGLGIGVLSLKKKRFE